MSANEIVEELLRLSPESRADLADQIVESLKVHIAPTVERSHLDEIALRRQQILKGQGSIIAGDEVLKQARDLLDR